MMPTTTHEEQILVASKLMQHYRVFTPISAAASIQAINDSAGNVELITQGNDGSLYNLWPDPASDSGWQITSLNTAQLNLGAVTSFTAVQDTSGNIMVLATFANKPGVTYSLSDARWSPGWQPVSSQAADAMVAAPRASVHFSVNNGSLYYQPTSGPTAKLSGDTQVSTTYVAGQNFAGFLEVFILGLDGSLYHTRAAPDLTQPDQTNPDPEAATNWTQLVKLNPVQDNLALQFTRLTRANDKDNYSKLFAISKNEDLYEVWQDAETSDWHFEEIDVPDYNPQAKGTPTEVNAYMTELTVQDAVGAPRPHTTVTLWSTDETTAVVNGRNAYLDAVTPYTCETNAAGKVTVVVENDTLDAPMLKVTTDFMDGDEYISIEPNAYIQEKLLSLTSDGLTHATNVFSSDPVTVISSDLPPETVSAVASGVSQCMSLAGGPIAPSQPVDIPGPADGNTATKYLSRNKKLSGLRYHTQPVAKFEHRIDFSRVKEQHWKFTFDHKTKNHRFEMLTREQAAGLMAERKSTLKPTSFLDGWFDVDWGDVWDSIESVAELVITTVVDTVTNVVTAIQAQVTLLIDGINYLFEQAVDLVEQVFDAVEGIFEAVGAFFEQLFDWLAFLFNWGDILLTQKAISGLVSQVALPFAGQVFGAGGVLNTTIKAQIQSFQNNLNSTFDAFLGSPGIKGNDSILALQQTIPPSDVEDQTAGTNLAFSGLMDNVNSVQYTNSTVAAALWTGAPEDNPFTNLIDLLKEQLGTFFDDPAFSHAVSYFQAIGDNPDQFLTNALSGILSVIQGVLNVALNVASAVVDAVFAAIQTALGVLTTLLTETLYVPLASELYTLVTGEENMSFLGLFSLVAAIPVTVGYKLIFGSTPFASQTAVDQFIQELNQALSPVTSFATGTPRATLTSQDVPVGVTKFLGSILVLALPVFGIVEGILDIWPIPPITPEDGEDIGLLSGVSKYEPPKVLARAALILEWIIWIGGLPTTFSTLNTCDADAFAVWTWFVAGISPALDSGWYIFTERAGSGTGVIMRNSGTLGTAMDWIVAMTQFGMLCGLVAKQVEEDKVDAAGTTQAFFAAIPGLFKFFRLPPINRWEPGLLILGGLDLIGDFGAALAEIVVVNELGGSSQMIEATV